MTIIHENHFLCHYKDELANYYSLHNPVCTRLKEKNRVQRIEDFVLEKRSIG